MTPKKKANELANKFITKSVFDMTDDELKEQRAQGKSFAIICVGEIINEINKYEHKHLGDIQFWGEVEQEIEKL
jgi:hypothetical protein